jgi:hypothetical protein
MNSNTNTSDDLSASLKQNAYLESLSEKEQKAYKIAKEHLGTSFDLELSRGYRAWVKTQQQLPPPTT